MKTTYLKLVENIIRKNSLIIILFFFTIPLLAQTGEIRGKVFSDDNKETIPGANVFIELAGKKIGTTTDVEGKFVLKPLPSGKYNVSISYTGYKTKVLNTVVVNPDKTTQLGDMVLALNVEEIPEIEIVAWKKKLIDAEEPTKTTTLAADLLKLPDNKSVIGIMATISSDIKVSEEGDVYIRGSRAGDEAYYVDGVLVKNIEHAVPGQAISSITVYTGGVPAQYGDLTGGAIIINTKSYFEFYNEWFARQYFK